MKSTAVEATLDVALETAPIVAILDRRQRRRFDRGVVCDESICGIKRVRGVVSCYGCLLEKLKKRW